MNIKIVKVDRIKSISFTALCLLLFVAPSYGQRKSKAKKQEIKVEDTTALKKVSLAGLQFRSIGPAVTGGRIIDIDVNPNDHSEYYVASGHGSLWKTNNNGVTISPAFEGQKSFAIGAVTIDPTNSNVVWVGTGENNAQANVIYGDGVYKSEDGGKTWKNKGLKESQHIGGIVVNPVDPNIVMVAAYGPQRNSGGDRGVFRTTDGGETWENVLFISEHTGCWQIHMDPSDSQIIYAVAHQRQRKLYTGVYGGPESGIYKSKDGGKTWALLEAGLPSKSVGRIGLAISPVDPNVVFAMFEAKEKGGIYKSLDKGASWSKVSDYTTSYGFYMHRLYCDPVDIDRIYAMDVFMKVSADGGKTWNNAGEKHKHVDNHSLWIDPNDNRHLIAGCDGGVYETFDQCKNWLFKCNIPITEIYKVTVDSDKPFYNIYVGTQDNNSLGGPSRTINSSGIVNSDWNFTWAGDGFETQVDWKDPNIVYSQSQFGGLVRHDRNTGEPLFIKPYEMDEEAYRFDWDAALLISSHDNHRLYFGGNKLLVTNDQGITWKELSGDLTRGVPDEMMDLMGRSWSIDEMARIGSMAQIVTIAESPLDEGILYVGSGDGLIHYSHDGGKTWDKGVVSGLPKYARVHHIIASIHDKMVAYAACQNFLDGDYNPYLYRTNDGGKSWSNISADLPERGSTYTVGEDHISKDLIFVGTQFGVFVSNSVEPKWVQLKNGLPTTTVMDLDIHRGENDLVVSTFGRGVYILDDYSPLRTINDDLIDKEAEIFPIEEGLMFVEADPFGFPGVGFQGSAFYSAPNPEVAATITYYVKDDYKSLKDKRRDQEKKAQKEGEKVKYPTYETLKSEKDEMTPYLLFTIKDENNTVVRTIKKDISKGVQRLNWDFRTATPVAVSLEAYDNSVPWNSEPVGYMVSPGKYTISMSRFDGEGMQPLVEDRPFECRLLNDANRDIEELKKFNAEVYSLSIAINGANAHKNHLSNNLPYLRKAALSVSESQGDILAQIQTVDDDLDKIGIKLNGDNLKGRYGASTIGLSGRVGLITGSLWSTTSTPTSTFYRAYKETTDKFEEVLQDLEKVEANIEQIEMKLEKLGAPYTPGRMPSWNRK
jgi:photosystem II stability/assembly factor-like uncharacterized protein